MQFVLENLPGNISKLEIKEMVDTVDRNGDGKISFSEFRYNRITAAPKCNLIFKIHNTTTMT